MSDVFISYARVDLALAEPIKVRLEGLGLSVFFDIDGSIDAGEAFPVRIGDAVTSARAVVALWTPHALTREWCRKECHLAQQLGKLVPIAMTPLTAVDLKEFVASSYESLTDFAGQEKHFGWSQVLSSIARKMDTWAENNAASPDAEKVIERAARVRRAALNARPTAATSSSIGLTGAAAIWETLRDSTDPADLVNFADQFPGTSEGLEARRRGTRLRDEARAWEKLNRTDQKSLEAFVAKYQGHPQIEEATRLLHQTQEVEAARRKRAESNAAEAAAQQSRLAKQKRDEEARARRRAGRIATWRVLKILFAILVVGAVIWIVWQRIVTGNWPMLP